MGLPRLSIKHPVTTLMVMLMAIVIGLVSLAGSPMELMPKLNPPIAVVMTIFPGASPTEVTNLVTKPLEDAVATTAGLTTLSSTSRENLSVLTIQFDWGTDMSEARADLQQAIDKVKLPDGAQKPSLVKFDPNAMPVMELTVAGKDLVALKAKLDEEVIPRLEKVDGVAAVFVTGSSDREIQVLLDPAKLNQYGLTQQQVAQVIQASNLTYPAGKIALGEKSLNLRIVGETNAVDQLKSLVIGQAAAGSPVPTAMPTQPGVPGAPAPSAPPQMTMNPIRLSDIAEVKDTQADATVLTRANGQPSLRISIQKEGEANTAEVTRAINDELDAINDDHRDLGLEVIMDQGEMVTRSISNVGMSLVGGGILAMLILLLFLRNIRPTLIIGVAIPFSVIVTFVLLFMNDLTMNLMTMGGLALGVGMLVDNAIVVIENIYRHLNELGEDPYTAAEKGADEVAGAITSSTLTTVAVFLPVMFVGGLTGELFTELALTVTFSLIASLAVALTVIPMMASRFLKAQSTKGRKRHEQAAAKENAYTRFLRTALGNRAVTLLVAVALLAGSLGLMGPEIGTEFIPEMDEGTFVVTVTMPPGTSLEAAAAKVDELAQAVSKAVPAEIVTTSTGRAEGLAGLSAALSGNSAGDGQIRVTLEDDYDESTAEAIKDARKALEKIQGNATLAFNSESTLNMGGARGNSIQVIITGPDQKTVKELVGEVQEEMASVEGLVNLENNLETSRPELQVIVDQEKAMKNGLAPAQVAVTVADAVKGKVVTRIETGDTSADVRVQFRAEDRGSISKIEAIRIKNALGRTVALSDLAKVTEATGPVSITREEQKASAQINGRFEDRDLGSVTADLSELIDGMDIPDGYEVTLGGTSKMMSEGFEGLGLALIMAVLLVYMIMAAQFESLRHPFTILFTLPLAAIGVVAGLFITDSAMGITAMIGIIILAGVVVNNGIVLVDFINQLRQEGMELTEAIVEAGRTRLRPILMTALTTILGLLPLALKLGEGSEVQAPMAVTVIGGLLTSTLLTLVVIPVMYSLFAFEKKAAVEDDEDDTEAVAALPVPAQARIPAPVRPVMAGAQSVPTAAPEVTVAPAPVAPAPVAPAPVAPAPAAESTPAHPDRMSDEELSQMLNLMGKLLSSRGK